MGSFKSVYNWLAHEVLGGSRTAAQVRYFVEEDLLGSAARSQQFVRCESSDAGSDHSDAALSTDDDEEDRP
jgi:hypothetical protein